MLTAKDIMHSNSSFLSYDTSISQAIEVMKKNSLGFIPVGATLDRLQGVLTEGSMMRIFLKYQSKSEGRDALIFYRDFLDPLQLVHQKTQFSDVVKKIMTAVGHRVFVINDKSEVIGYISAKDILPFFSSEEALTKKPRMDSVEEIKSDLYLFESFFSKSPFMMHSVATDGHIQMANEMLHAVLGYPYSELIGKTIFDLYSKEAHQSAELGLQKIMDQGYHKVVHSQMLSKSGEKIEVELVSRALQDQNGKPIGTITVSRPIDMNYLLKVLPHLA